MPPHSRWLCASLPMALALAACEHPVNGGGKAPDSKPARFAVIDWDQLIPAEEMENHRLAVAFSMRNIDHGTDQRAAQFGSFKTVAALERRSVALPGYVVPLDTDDQGRMTAFFFVPSMGACIHVPPPPPDQIVYATLSQAVPAPALGESSWLRGTLHAQTHDLEQASAAYSMNDAQLAARRPGEQAPPQ
jgi:hypothetical protein